MRASIVTPLFERDPDIGVRLLLTGMPPQAFDTLRPMLKVFPFYYRLRHKIRSTRIERDRQDVRESLDRIAAELRPSGYLVGERFSVADLTAAALLGVALQPPQIQYPLAITLPDYIKEWQAEIDRHPAAQWVRDIYQRFRGASAEIQRGD